MQERPSGGQDSVYDVQVSNETCLKWDMAEKRLYTDRGYEVIADRLTLRPKVGRSNNGARPEQVLGDYSYAIRPDGTVRLLSYRGTGRDLVLPDTIEGRVVTSIASNMLCGNDSIESLVLPDTVVYLGHRVFANCRNLKRVCLSGQLEKLGTTEFAGCVSLKEVAFRSPLVLLENATFSSCPITLVHLGATVQDIRLGTFRFPHLQKLVVDAGNRHYSTDGKALYSLGGTILIRLIVPCERYTVREGCLSIGEKAFESHEVISSVVLPMTLLHIGRLAFAKAGLRGISFPSSLRSIGDKAFFHCRNMAHAVFMEGVEEIGEYAFSFTALEQASLPASLRYLGFRAFENTPAQNSVMLNSISISNNNKNLRIDSGGGLYRQDIFIELISHVKRFSVLEGTRTIAPNAFRNHVCVEQVFVPEGVIEIGDNAFRGVRSLTHVDLPESLELIGEKAFVDTSLVELSLSDRVRKIGTNALLVQGESQLMPHRPIAAIHLGKNNTSYYIESGLLCERGAVGAQDDICLLYVGPESIVHIPERVSRISSCAFCGVSRIDELHVHGHLRSICFGAFNVSKTIPRIHIDFTQPVDGYSCGDFLIPHLSARFKTLSLLLLTDGTKTIFNFEYYDSWISQTTEVDEYAPAIINRLMRPMGLTKNLQRLYIGILKRHSAKVCNFFILHGDMDALMLLQELGVLTADIVEDELRHTLGCGATVSMACLLELKRLYFPSSGIDFSL